MSSDRTPIGNRMTPESWQRVKQLFQSVIECETSQRAAFLDQACAGDPDLRRELEILLASDARAENFLEAPAAKLCTDEPAEPLIGRRIGPYQILREIARSGMGAVYLAERADDQFQKLVAIKVVKRHGLRCHSPPIPQRAEDSGQPRPSEHCATH